jgi:AraC-like DNA-binding protein
LSGAARLNKMMSRGEFENDGAESIFLRPLEFTTHELQGQDQFEVFRAAHENIADLYLIRSRDTSFPICQQIWDLEKLVLVYTQLPGEGYAFGWRHLKRATLDHWYLVLPLSFEATRRSHNHRDSAPSLHCLMMPFESAIEDDGVLLLFIPRELFPSTCWLDNILDRPLDLGTGMLLADYLFLLHRHLPLLRTSELPGVLEASRSLIAACAAPTRENLATAQIPIGLTLLERARRLIGRRLAEPDLSPDSLCKELHVSRSRLYRLFELLGGVSAYIRHQRLLRARDALLDMSDPRSINSIAEHWGFFDASTFSRAFKQEFGLSPTDVREASWASNGYLIGQDKPRAATKTSGLEELLRRLRA